MADETDKLCNEVSGRREREKKKNTCGIVARSGQGDP